MNRRHVLAGLASGWGLSPTLWLAGCASPPQPPSPSPATPELSPAATWRVVNRLGWGANDTQMAEVARWGLSTYLHHQLTGQATGAWPAGVQDQIGRLSISQRSMADLLRSLEAQRKGADAQAGEDARKTAQQAYQQDMNRLAREAATRQLLRALHSPHALQEHLTWFWFNHFNVHQSKHNLRAMVADFEDSAIRPHALGSFRAMLGAVTRHPAMLRYLDNDQNAANRLNENLGRELLELHTLGVHGGYSQRDVQELARVLTGHGYSLDTETPRLKPEWRALHKRDGAYEFNPARHDFGDKTVLGQFITGKGAAELDEVLDRLALHPSTARRLSFKLAQYLLADEPPSALVDRMAQAYLGSRGLIAPTLRVLLTAPEFSAEGPGKFKDPVHYVLSALRAAYDGRAIVNTQPVLGWINRLGQGLYQRPTPDGYAATADAWNSPGQMSQRFEVARAMGSGSAGLFKPEEPAGAAEQPAFPQLARPAFYRWVQAGLGEGTRQALAQAASPQDWNTLYLAAPEFMVR